jgi:hypothetical protein
LLATLIGVGLLLTACSDAECVSGPLCEGDDVVTGTISGSVRAGTSGLGNVVVTLSDGTAATTASNGSYSIADVPLGTYTVRISQLPPSVSCSTTSRPVTLTNAARQATVDFACERLDIGTPVGR